MTSCTVRRHHHYEAWAWVLTDIKTKLGVEIQARNRTLCLSRIDPPNVATYIFVHREHERLMKQGQDANESFSFFVESSSLQRQPSESYIERACILRILFSIKNLDISDALSQLTGMGVFVGAFNIEHLRRVHFEQRLTLFDAAQTMDFFSTLAVDAFDDIVTEVLAAHNDEPNRSPFLCLKRTFEENFGVMHDCEHVLIWLFFALHNWECARDELLVLIFQKLPRFGNSQDVVMKLLGFSFHSHAAEKHVATDACIVLRFLRFHNTPNLHSAVSLKEQPTSANPLSDTMVAQRQCRFKLSKLRERVLNKTHTKKSATGEPLGSWKPKGLPITEDVWDSYSKAHQQCIILLSSMSKSMADDVDDLINTFLAECEIGSHGEKREHFKKYQPQMSDTDNICQSIYYLLSRFSHVVDVDQTNSFLFVNSFTQSCFEHMLGISQLNAMSLCLKVQIFVCCHLIEPIRKQTFHALISNFNRRAFKGDTKNQLPTFISSNVDDSIAAWSQNNKFPRDLVKTVLAPLCT